MFPINFKISMNIERTKGDLILFDIFYTYEISPLIIMHSLYSKYSKTKLVEQYPTQGRELHEKRTQHKDYHHTSYSSNIAWIVKGKGKVIPVLN
jgi:hypothetical protein